MLQGYDFHTVTDAIDHMKFELGAETDKELAEALGLDPSAVSAWRRRKKIPEKYKLRFYRTLDQKQIENVKSQPEDNLRDSYIFALICISIENAANDIRAVEDADFLWLGSKTKVLLEKLKKYFAASNTDALDASRRKFSFARSKIREGDIWLDTLN